MPQKGYTRVLSILARVLRIGSTNHIVGDKKKNEEQKSKGGRALQDMTSINWSFNRDLVDVMV